MKKMYLFVSLIALVGLTSCGVGAAEDFTKEFHEKLDNKEYDYIVQNMLDPISVAETGEQQWYDMFAHIETNWGTAISRDEAFDFESNTTNGITTVTLNYNVNFKDVTMFERIFLVDRGDGFKVTGLFLNTTKEGLEAMMNRQ